jgi:N-acetylglucosaminyldiphosphoundecaprenol N-acetyl-beta-D-mannosaminyltransferase
MGAAFPTYDVLGVPVSVTTLDAASTAMRQWAKDNHGRFVCVRDVHGIMLARKDAGFRELHGEAAIVTPDGLPLVWIGRRRGLPVERTCGPDLMTRLMSDTAKGGERHYFYGGREGIAARLRERLSQQYSGLSVVGTETPPFRELSSFEVRSLADRLNASGADLVWIGLSTPKQEHLMRKLAPLVTSTLIGVGAAFDVHSGEMRRAPLWMQRNGLEWLFRLMSEPRRLWRRYLLLAPQFIWHIALNAWSKR